MKVIFTLLLLLITIKSYSQIEFDFSGYLVDLPVYQRYNSNKNFSENIKKDIFLNQIRTRLRPNFYFGDYSRLQIEYEISAVYFTSPIQNFQSSNNNSNRQLIDLNWSEFPNNNILLNHYLDRFYYKTSFNWGSLTLGRQRISWGTGRIWNPTDLFNPISPVNFSKIEKDGTDAVALKIFIGNFTDLEIVANPTRKIKNSNFGARFRTNISEYDFSIIFGRFDNRIINGFDFAGNFFDAGIRGELLYSINESDSKDNFVKVIFGFDYQFSPSIYSLIEYHFNGDGFSHSENYDFDKFSNGQILNLSKNYINITSTILLHPLVNSSISYNKNLNDGSGFASLSLDYSFSENINLKLATQIFHGFINSEYSYFPNAFYFQGEYYF